MINYNRLDKVVNYGANLNPKNRVTFYINFYKKNKEIINIKKAYLEKNYECAFFRLVTFVNKNSHFLSLNPLIIDDHFFIDRHLNDYKKWGIVNHCVIRTKIQLVQKLYQLRSRNKSKVYKRIEEFIDLADKSGNALILIDKLDDYRTAFREFSHDFNSWLTSGCPKKAKDWRKYIPKNNFHRQLDSFLWEKLNH